MNWYLEALKKYAVFDGRARRKEYWYFMLFNFIFSFGLLIVDVVIGAFSAEVSMGLLSGIYTLAVLIPGIAVSVRRLHDTNRSGLWLLIGIIPLIGGLILLVFMVQDSQPGENQYGPHPKVTADPSSVAEMEHNRTIKQQKTRPAPAVELGERVSITPPVEPQQTDIDEEGIYATIANELETGIADKGLWTRLFAECGGDEKQTKVLYIKERADRLISAERLRLEQAARLASEHADEAARLDQIRFKLKKEQEAEQKDKIQDLSETLLKNITQNNLQEVNRLLTEEPLLVAVKNRDRETPLHIAVREKNLAMARLLLENGAMIDENNCGWVTPLEYAQNSRQDEMVKLLTSYAKSRRSG